MIAKLQGEILDVRNGHIIVDVHGVGYLLSVRATETYTKGDTVSLYTYLAVRENALDLYGFQNEDAHTMFLHLIKLPKIGPKTALQILSQADVATLKKSASANDPAYLSKISGMSRKTAEKIVAGLKDIEGIGDTTDGTSTTRPHDADVIDALITLGYSQKDALEAVQKIPAEILGTNERIKQALKYVA